MPEDGVERLLGQEYAMREEFWHRRASFKRSRGELGGRRWVADVAALGGDFGSR